MEKEKKRFTLSSLLRIYLSKKKDKSLHCHGGRPPPAGGTAADEPAPPPSGRDWTVKLSPIIYLRISAGGLWSGLSCIRASRGAPAE